MLDMFVDSMASVFILRRTPPGFRVTNGAPGFSVDQLSGAARVQCIGDATLYLELENDGEYTWTPFPVTNIHIVPDATVDLYATRVMRDLHAATHRFESPVQIELPGGTARVHDSGNAFVARVGFGPWTASPRAMPAVTTSLVGDSPTAVTVADGSRRPLADGPAVPQSLLWHRVGFPHEGAWRHVTTAFANHGQPPNAVLSTTLAARDAVMRGRARALPFVKHAPTDHTLPPPGAVFYMDFAGPMIASHPHRFTCYSGIVDAGSSYGRAFPAHQMTKEVARATYETFVSDLSSKMGLTHQIKPQIVVSDQGSAYVAHYFREFLSGQQVLHRLASTYTPQQNSYVERMWGVTFATARVLLAAANLPPIFHPYAIQTSRWLHNRLPMPSRANMSPYNILTRQPADMTYLYAFGSLCSYTIPAARRDGDKHFADRGAAGIYLGPSEESPASVVYVPSSRTVVVTRHVRCYEDRFPGVHGFNYAWFPPLSEEGASPPLRDPTSATPSNLPQPPPPNTPTAPPAAHNTPHSNTHAPSPPLFASPLGQTSPASPPHSPSPPVHQHDVTLPGGRYPPRMAPNDPQSRQEGAVPPFVLPTAEGAPIAHPQATNPSSTSYDRHANQPQLRRARQQIVQQSPILGGGFRPRAQYVDPLNGQTASAMRNFAMLALATNIGYDPAVSYGLESTADVSEYAASGQPIALRVDVRSTVEMGDVVVPRSYKQAITSNLASYWREAITKEISGLVALKTWSVVLLSSVPAGANVMGSHFVFDVKRNQLGEIEKFKARLVADGNTQLYGVDFDRIFSTVVKMSTIRLVLAIAALKDYNLSSIDIRQAYLQAELKEDLYMRVPPGHPRFDGTGRPLALKLNRSLYGLKQAGREWNKLLVQFLLNWGFMQSVIDVCLFTYSAHASMLWLLVWVDDIILVENDDGLRTRFVSSLSDRFPTEDKGTLEWIVGVRVTRDRTKRTLSLSQELYVSDLLGRYETLIESGRRYTSPMDEKAKLSPDFSPAEGSPEYTAMADKRHEYMSIVGGILWLANVTRFELAFAASQLARFVSNPGELHFAAAVRVLLYLKASSARVLTFSPTARPFEVYVDSDWAVKFSSSGALFFYGGCLVHWFAKMQRSVSFSSAESEIFGAILAAKEGIFIRELLADLGLAASGATRIYSDSKSAVDLAYDPVAFKKTKHILRAAHGLRDYVARDVYEMIHVAGSINLADILTKAQSVAAFNTLMQSYDAFVAATASPV